MQFISDDGGSDKMVEKIYRFSRNKFARVHPEYRRFNNSRLTYQIFHVDLSNNGRNKKVSPLYIYIVDFLIVLFVETLNCDYSLCLYESKNDTGNIYQRNNYIIQMIKLFSYFYYIIILFDRKNLRIFEF